LPCSIATLATIMSTTLLAGIVYLVYKIDWEKYFPFEKEHDKKES